MNALRRRLCLTASILVLSTFAVVGCTAFNPHISYPGRSAPAAGAGALDTALARLYATRQKLEDALTEQMTIRSVSNTGALAGGIGALAAGLYQGSRDLIVGFGLGGGGSYAAGQVYGPKGYADAYRLGRDALSCVDAAASPVAASLGAMKGPANNLRLAWTDLKQKMANGEKASEPTSALTAAIKEAKEVEQTAKKALIGVDGAFALERPLANQVEVAIDGIMIAVDARVSAAQPDPATVAQLVRSVGQLGLSGIDAAKADTAQLAKAVRDRRISESSTDLNAALIKEIKDAVEIAKQALDSLPRFEITVDILRASLGGCRVPDAAAVTLAKHSPGEVQIAKESVDHFMIDGGQAPYIGEFLGTPLKGLELDPRVSHDGRFALRTTKDFAGGEVSVRISEIKPKPASLEFKVKGK